MAKKRIPPDQQTNELARANFEFMKRNPEKFEAFKKRVEKAKSHSGRIEELFLSGKICKHRYAAKAAFRYQPSTSPKNSEAYKKENAYLLEEMIRYARLIFSSLTDNEPDKTLLIGVDLGRTKAAIMAEIEKIVNENLSCYRGKNYIQSRDKWLPLLDEILEVWDLYSAAGQQPVKTTFRQISKKVGRPLSTVRDQWLIAYEKIFDEQYKAEEKYSTEEKRASADEFCAKCPHIAAGKTPKCYRNSDFIPCAEYLRLAGKERTVKNVEFIENIDYESKKKELAK